MLVRWLLVINFFFAQILNSLIHLDHKMSSQSCRLLKCMPADITVTSGEVCAIIMTSIQISSEDTWKLSWIHPIPCKPCHTKHIRADSLCFGVCISGGAPLRLHVSLQELDQAARLQLCNFPYSSNSVPDSGAALFWIPECPWDLSARFLLWYLLAW